MKRYWNWIVSRLGLTDRIERFVAGHRAALFWERVWLALWPASAVIGLFMAAALFGLFGILPWELDALIFSGALAAFGWALFQGFADYKFPSWAEGARRLEQSSALEHRPITERDDVIAAGIGDDMAESLWHAHMKRLLSRIANLRVTPPSPGLNKRDPYALRYAALFVLILGFIVAGPDSGRRLMQSLQPELISDGSNATLDAWITPPNYTGQAPIYLGRAPHKAVTVPAGSDLVMRVHGARGRPDVIVMPSPHDAPQFRGKNGEFSAEYRIAANGAITVRGDGATLGSWNVRAVPDNPPVIAFSQKPSRTERDSVKLAFTAGDDYGVAGVRALIRPVKDKTKMLAADLPLDSTSSKTLTETVYKDFTENPFAGLDVEITLEARDGAGQTGLSKPVRFTLPAKIFTNPLARALIEQRQNLALGGMHAKDFVARVLDALTIAPEHFYQGQTPIYMSIRAAYWSARTARYPEDIAHTQDLLWQTAMAIEGGGISQVAAELRRLQEMLSQALAQGAPQDQIDALLQKYADALKRYLQTLAQNPPLSDVPLSPNAKVLSPDDLQAMLKVIQQLAQSGARAQAAQMLALLQSMLENLHMTAGTGNAQMSPEDQQLSNALKNLGDLMGRQRQLLDKTFRQQQGNADPKDGGAKGLAQQEGKLRDDLQKALNGLKDAPKSLGDAGKNMGQAQGSLGQQDFDSAGQSEQQALDQLRKGAGDLAKTLMARTGQPGTAGNDDPFGRAQSALGTGAGGGVKIPDEAALERARSILLELRKRAAERGRPKEELDYIDRLLKEF
jgi:uncharacterized protein (TIGR02302 family)